MSKSAFPDPADALNDPPGLIAVGGDLTNERLTDAYRHGIFPWFEVGQPILWWTPPTRAVIETSTFTPSRSLRQWLRRAPFRVELNTDFNRVIEGCRSHRMERDEEPGLPRRCKALTNAARTRIGSRHLMLSRPGTRWRPLRRRSGVLILRGIHVLPRVKRVKNCFRFLDEGL